MLGVETTLSILITKLDDAADVTLLRTATADIVCAPAAFVARVYVHCPNSFTVAVDASATPPTLTWTIAPASAKPRITGSVADVILSSGRPVLLSIPTRVGAVTPPKEIVTASSFPSGAEP